MDGSTRAHQMTSLLELAEVGARSRSAANRSMAPSLMSWLSEFWNAWGLRITCYLSFSAHVLLIVFARSRRHGTSRWQRSVLWLAYQTAEIAATYALGDLALNGTDDDAASPSPEQQLIAFWAPFLLLHLGGPDNITAYAIEDNKLSMRKWYEMGAQVVGAIFTWYTYIYLGGSRALLAASLAMAPLALFKYAEKAWALHKGNLGNMRSSSEGMSSSHHMDLFVSSSGREVHNDEQALLYAHNLFRFCKRAMFDSSVHTAADDDDDSSGGGYATSVKIFSLEWKGIFKVVEMELSLMYDILYTKAAVVHTWSGYLLRLISPFATAAATFLFWTWAYQKHGLEPADVRFTYIMLATALFLDVLWLVRALGSSWTYSFLIAQPPELHWLQHGVVCSGRWRRFHRFLASLDPCWLVFGKDPASYRRWSGVTGRYNLLQECSTRRADGSDRVPWTSSHKFLTSLFGCQKEDVKKMLFQRIKQRLPLPEQYHPVPQKKEQYHPKDAYDMVDITTRWGHVAVRKFTDKRILKGLKLKLNFGREFQEDVLVWHIGTCIFLNCTDEPLRGPCVKAIVVLSEYLMFLVAARPHMLPGLVLRSLFEDTFRALGQEWKKTQSNGRIFGAASRENKLANALHDGSFENQDRSQRERDGKRKLMLDGIEVGMELLKFHDKYMDELLELIFDVWVDKLMYASTRCSRESHAKQLSRGGELTTIVWIMVEHAGLFRIGETNDQTSDRTSYILKMGEEERTKKKQPEEKKPDEPKKEEAKPEPPAPYPPRPIFYPVPPPAPYPAPIFYPPPPPPPAPPPPPPPPPYPGPMLSEREEAEEKKKKEEEKEEYTGDGGPMLSERARKRRARTTTYATLYPA